MNTERLKHYLVIDGGGTKTAAILANDHGLCFKGYGGSANVTTADLSKVISSIKSAVEQALQEKEAYYQKMHIPACKFLNINDLSLDILWVGLAGIHSIQEKEFNQIYLSIKNLFRDIDRFDLTSDLFLIPVALNQYENINYCVSVIAGTGSSSMLFKLLRSEKKCKLLGRSGGWGPSLGDCGSGFSIGMEIIRSTLSSLDSFLTLINLGCSELQLKFIHREVFKAIVGEEFDLKNASKFLFSVNRILNDRQDPASQRRKIASLAKIVFDQMQSSDGSCLVCAEIIRQETLNLSKKLLTFQKIINETSTLLVLTGTLFSLDVYKNLFFSQLKSQDLNFQDFVYFPEPGMSAMKSILRQD